ncbi:helix-turn-helix domain-containing protein [Roseibaca sp. V10]|uniref:Helix-turn-helix domain-containing protein n=1 Tax=Roseinatronobacter domitianus TaxID=2940293 RepID=A0ABT0M1H1_9RHOB|nr:DUF6456 domain-containing protein [Roseibaca domitiana]MCL1628709.1 helix-turn-helix domain-containing protein [Roseibaca domitiana]
MSAQTRVDPGCTLVVGASLPDWVPKGARLYLSHTAEGLSLRALARNSGCHASTVLRQVRRFENRRDDPLVDDALNRLDQVLREPPPPQNKTERSDMAQSTCLVHDATAPTWSSGDLVSVLRDLDMPGAQLVVAPDMPKAMVLRDMGQGRTERVRVFDRTLAEMLALKAWITCCREGRVRSYVASPEGLAALRAQDDDSPTARRVRYGTVETPIAVLARRRDKSGTAFLVPELVHAADRLREDFVMAQLDRLEPMPVDRLTRALQKRALPGPNIAPPGTRAARGRVLGALQDLGPGLSDMVLRVCCHLEGVESAEQAMGWCARSGKIVLRIGLQRLKLHYDRLGADDMLMG